MLLNLASDSLASARRGALTGRGALANNQQKGVFLYSLASDSLASARRGALAGRGALANNQKKDCFFIPSRPTVSRPLGGER